MSHGSIGRVLGMAAVVAAMACAVGVPSAAAATGPNTPPRGGAVHQHATLTVKGGQEHTDSLRTGGGAAIPCAGFTGMPVRAGDDAFDYAYTQCTTSAATYIASSMYRPRWYGSQHLDSTSGSGSEIAEDYPEYRCAGQGTYTYYVYSFHEAVVGGETGTANTSGGNRFGC